MNTGQGSPLWQALSLPRAPMSWDSDTPTAPPFKRQDTASAIPPEILLGTVFPFILGYFINHMIGGNSFSETCLYTGIMLRNILQI